MAGSESQKVNLEDELSCSICTEVLYQPLTLLDCLHTFCGACLKEWFAFQLSTSRSNPNAHTHTLPDGTSRPSSPYTCPSCREPVRGTKHNATVKSLLDMFVAANPDKARTEKEIEELNSKYKVGEEVLIQVDDRELSLRERRVVDADRRRMDEVRERSLREVGMGSAEPRESGRRRRAHGSRTGSRDRGETIDDRDRERDREAQRERRRRRDAERAARGDGPSSSTTALTVESEAPDERRRRSHEDRRRRTHAREESQERAVRQIEHQSSLRSLISSSDVDSREMEEEILRQIREEGLLDGIDLENIDVNQEDQISERIAEAFRRRQEERARQEEARRSSTNARRRGTSNPESREASGDDGRPSSRRRTHSRTPSAVSQEGHQSRPPQSMSVTQAAHLEVQSNDESRQRHRRATSGSRSATDPLHAMEPLTRPAARSQSDLTDRAATNNPLLTRPAVSASARSNTDPSAEHISELSLPERPRQQRSSPHSSPRTQSTARMEDSQPPPNNSERRTRAAPPADILVPPTTTAAVVADRALAPPISPGNPSRMSLSDRAAALASGSRPATSSSTGSRPRSQTYPEPNLTCVKCSKPHIEYDLHYNCGICFGGNYNICLSCYRSGAGCLHWFGFGHAAWARWEVMNQSSDTEIERPHMLTPSRYLPPKSAPGGADGRKTLTTDDPQKRLQSGTFCATCLAWTNECYWRCDMCNDGDWGFCNTCVNQGKSCNHSLLPLTYKPPESGNPPLSPTYDQQTPASASILTGPGVIDIGPFKPLTFSTKCDICLYPIQPSQTRYHCFSCTSKVPGTLPGDYDICPTCYPKLTTSRRISLENGHNGWRRCLQGHRMVIVGFEDNRGGQRRVLVKDLVGGRGLHEQPYVSSDHPQPGSGGSASDLQKWSWGDGIHVRGDDSHVKLVTTDVMKSAPREDKTLILDDKFPPDGGVGMRATAAWAWWPKDGDEGADELPFPKGAEIRECKDVNGDWWHGTYCGKRGLFPSNFVRVLDRGL